jgi:glycosyltransferase involved in cell wall biosynthesis
MKIGYFINQVDLSGGIKVILQHVKILKEMGYPAILISRSIKQKESIPEETLAEALVISRKDKLDDVPMCDVYVGTYYNDVRHLVRNVRSKVVHLCQGYEPIKYMGRVKKEFLPEKYSKRTLFSILRQMIDNTKSKRRVRRVEGIYSLPTVKAAVSRHLVDLIEKKYGQKCHLIQNGIDPAIFYPDEKRVWGRDGKIKIFSVGSVQVGFKGIQDTLNAVELLKKKGAPVELIRVSPTPPSGKELEGKVVDRYYEGLSEKEMSALYRNVDIFISSSLELEGFGLPAMEALASGVPSILTEISSYQNFDEKKDFAYFVPTGRPDRIAEGILALMNHREFREKCIRRGLLVSRNYTIETTARHLSGFFKSAF